MSKICISSCVDDTRVPVVRATYVNLYKWPESDVEFVKSASMHGGARLQSRVVDSISCRQMYLRSYTFSREETVPVKTVKCLGRVKDKVVARQHVVVIRGKEFSRAVLCAIFKRLLFCSASIDVVDNHVL